MVRASEPSDDNSATGEKSISGVADRVALLLQVARNVQNRLGDICDAAEKVKKSVKTHCLDTY